MSMAQKIEQVCNFYSYVDLRITYESDIIIHVDTILR